MSYNPKLILVNEIESYLRGIDPNGHDRGTVVHHTWSPTLAQWNGRASMLGAYNYRRNTFGWVHGPAQFWAAPEGVWTMRPFSYRNGAHAAATRSMSSIPSEVRAWMENVTPSGTSITQAANYWATGVEIVGNFDSRDPGTHPSVATAIALFAAMHRVWDIPVKYCFPHRAFAAKSCPGSRFDMDGFRDQILNSAGVSIDPKRVRVVDKNDNEVPGYYWLGVDGRTYGPIAEAVTAVGGWCEIQEWGATDKVVRIHGGG